MLRNILILFFVFLVLLGQSQRIQGSWQDYLSYSEATKIAVSPERIYCATEGGLFFYDLQDNSINKFSGFNELSDFGIKTIAFSISKNVLVVAYKNSNIDLVYEDRVVNISDIKRKQITGDKTIYNITFIGNEAYLSCGFGIVVLNLDKEEIKDTYYIGEGGSLLCVNDVETDGYYIYAATNEGILRAVFEGTNLPDYQNWELIENIPFYTEKFNFLEFFNGSIITNYTPDEYAEDKLYRLNGDEWIDYLPQIRYTGDIQEFGDYMTIASREVVYIIDKNHSVIGSINQYELSNQTISPINPRSTGISSGGDIFIADFKNAMVKITGQNFESVFPGGPMDNNMFSILANGNELWIAPGGRSDSWNNTFQLPHFQNFGGGEWNYYSKDKYPELDGFFDIVCLAVDPSNPSHIFAGSWGGGVLEYQNEEFLNRYTNLNSPLQTSVPTNPEEPYVRIGGMDFDSNGDLWITNSTVARNLLKLSMDGNWEEFTLPEVANSLNIGQVIVSQNDDKWIIVPRGHDAYVVDRTGERKKRLQVTSYFNNGENEIFNRMNDIYSIAEDNEGSIWIGTSKGVAVYNNPYRIWDASSFYAVQPSLDLNDGLYHPLLETETVTAIAVDGANRKWLGTQNSGLYLVSENGDKEILHFTTTNSPLYSNHITSIAINQKNGEVFIGTNEGLISYMGEAIGGKETYADVYVYPNPVRETYDGPVTITGLKENTEIKITDISGNLVFRTQSLGGQAIWDGKNLNGNRVRTGVYLVLCNDELGEETHITKLLFIN